MFRLISNLEFRTCDVKLLQMQSAVLERRALETVEAHKGAKVQGSVYCLDCLHLEVQLRSGMKLLQLAGVLRGTV